MNEGRLAYGLEADGRRYLDTAELLRAFGSFKAPSRDETPEMSHSVTVPSELAETIAQAVAAALAEVLPKALAEVVEPLRKEIELLRLENAEQRLIEHKPDTTAAAPAAPAAPQPDQPSAPIPANTQAPSLAEKVRERPQTFADLVLGLDQ